MLQQDLGEVRNPESGHSSRATVINFFHFFLCMAQAILKELENLLIPWRKGIAPPFYSGIKVMIIRPLGRNESIGPVRNIVTKVRMSICDNYFDVFASGSATTVPGDLLVIWYYRTIWPGQAVGRDTICPLSHLASIYNQGIMINVKHDFLLVWNEKRKVCYLAY